MVCKGKAWHAVDVPLAVSGLKNGWLSPMKEQQVNGLLAALEAQTQAQLAQTAAINRLAESNEALVAVIYQSVVDDDSDDGLSTQTYLSGKPRR